MLLPENHLPNDLIKSIKVIYTRLLLNIVEML